MTSLVLVSLSALVSFWLGYRAGWQHAGGQLLRLLGAVEGCQQALDDLRDSDTTGGRQ